jgi:hypothetical protein
VCEVEDAVTQLWTKAGQDVQHRDLRTRSQRMLPPLQQHRVGLRTKLSLKPLTGAPPAFTAWNPRSECQLRARMLVRR